MTNHLAIIAPSYWLYFLKWYLYIVYQCTATAKSYFILLQRFTAFDHQYRLDGDTIQMCLGSASVRRIMTCTYCNNDTSDNSNMCTNMADSDPPLRTPFNISASSFPPLVLSDVCLEATPHLWVCTKSQWLLQYYYVSARKVCFHSSFPPSLDNT